ncbi:MAG: hypothetical protein AAB863_00910, partial [Patescibacteria group bacterium]
ENKIRETEVNIAIQINGRVRAVIKMNAGAGEQEVEKVALEMPDVKKWIDDKEIKKVIFVQDRILNIVV